MDSFREITRALYLKEKFESIVAELPSSFPYKHLNDYTAGVLTFYMVAGIDNIKQFEIAAIAKEFKQISISMAQYRDSVYKEGI